MTFQEQFLEHPIIFSILFIGLLACLIPVLWMRRKCLIGRHEPERHYTPFGDIIKCKNCGKRL